jgi:hypothetical protein
VSRLPITLLDSGKRVVFPYTLYAFARSIFSDISAIYFKVLRFLYIKTGMVALVNQGLQLNQD